VCSCQVPHFVEASGCENHKSAKKKRGWVPWFCREDALLHLWQVPDFVEVWGPKSQVWLYKMGTPNPPRSFFGGILYVYIYMRGILCDIMCLQRNILTFFRSALNVQGDLWFSCISWCSFGIVMCVIPGETSYSYCPYQTAEHYTALVQCSFVFSLVSTGCIYPLVIQHNENDRFIDDLPWFSWYLPLFKKVDLPLFKKGWI
jgi:hypothetical protein